MKHLKDWFRSRDFCVHDWHYSSDGKSRFSPSRDNIRTCVKCGRVEREHERYLGHGNYVMYWKERDGE